MCREERPSDSLGGNLREGWRGRKDENLGVGVLCGSPETTLNLWLAWTTVETQLPCTQMNT